MKDSRPAKPERRWYEFNLRTLLVFVSEANTLSARRSVMNNSAFWSVVLVLAALTAGSGTPPSPEQSPISSFLSKSTEILLPAAWGRGRFTDCNHGM